jgi:hypothetical protein
METGGGSSAAQAESRGLPHNLPLSLTRDELHQDLIPDHTDIPTFENYLSPDWSRLEQAAVTPDEFVTARPGLEEDKIGNSLPKQQPQRLAFSPASHDDQYTFLYPFPESSRRPSVYLQTSEENRGFIAVTKQEEAHLEALRRKKSRMREALRQKRSRMREEIIRGHETINSPAPIPERSASSYLESSSVNKVYGFGSSTENQRASVFLDTTISESQLIPREARTAEDPLHSKEAERLVVLNRENGHAERFYIYSSCIDPSAHVFGANVEGKREDLSSTKVPHDGYIVLPGECLLCNFDKERLREGESNNTDLRSNLPLSSKKAHILSTAEWEDLKPIIQSLYLDDGKTVRAVLDILGQKFPKTVIT